MNTTTRLAAYGGILVAAFTGAAGIGLAAGPIDTGGDTVHDGDHDSGHDSTPLTAAAPDVARSGTSLDAAGFRLAPDVTVVQAGRQAEYSFRIVDGTGAAVTGFETRHERDLHLVVASRDLRDFHHLHPEQDGRGTWTIRLPGLQAGTYRVFADAQPAGSAAITLGIDLHVVGGTAPLGETDPDVTTDRVDGFDVTLSDDLAVGGGSLRFAVERNGEPVTTEQYLGAAGHLVVLRVGDLAYVHAHADEGDEAIGFDVDVPTAGIYRLFLDFAVGGEVHTADFTLSVPDDAASPAATEHTTAATTAPSHGGH